MRRQLFCLVALLLLCLTTLPSPAQAGATRTVTIRVAKNDTLINLCRKYLREPGNWRAIAALNKLAHPDRLSPGETIAVPVDMLKAVPLEARVTFLKGSGMLRAPGAAEWSPLQAGEILRVGSSLKSGPASSIEVAFADGTRFLLRENTVITVKAAQQGLLHLLRVLYLEAGKVVTRVKGATGRDSRFEIETPSALAAARGTEYRVGLDASGATRAELLESSIGFSAMGSTVTLNKDEGSLARFQEPPTPARKLLPPPDPVGLRPSYGESPLTLRFAVVPGAAAYRAVLARDREGKDAVKEATIQPGESFEVAAEADGSYYLIASSIDAEGLEGPLSQPAELVLRKEARKIEPPVLSAPSDAARLQTTGTVVSWSPVPGAARYRLQLAGEPEFRQPVADETLPGTSYPTGALTTGSYFVRVAAERDGVAGAWSAVTGFAVLQLPAPELRKTRSAGGKGWDFSWEPPAEGISSQCQVASDPGFGAIILDRTQREPELHLEQKLAPGTYYVRIRGVDSRQRPGSFSEAASFVVEKPARFPYEFIGAGALLLLLLL